MDSSMAHVTGMRCRIAILLLSAALFPASALKAAQPAGSQNPKLTALFARMAASASERKNATPTSAPAAPVRKRVGSTPFDAMMARIHALSTKTSASQAQVKPNTQVDFTIPQFQTAPQFATSGLDPDTIYASAAGDFNGDGVADVVTVNQDGGVNIFLNAGNGVMKLAYTDSSLPATGQPHTIYQVSTADLNGDGFADIVALDFANNQFDVWLSNGDGTLAPPLSYSVAPSSGASFFKGGGGIAIADVTGDGHLDVVAMTADYEHGRPKTVVSLQVFAGNGDGTFAAPTESDTTLNDVYHAVFGQTLVLADMNGDGIADAVVLLDDEGKNSTFGLGVMTALGDGTGGFGTFSGYTGAFAANTDNDYYGTSNLVVADMNGDGSADVAFADVSGTLHVALNQGSGSFLTAKTAVRVPGNSLFLLGDMNGDKTPDIVAFGPGIVSVYLGKGDGSFSQTPHTYAGGVAQDHEEPALANYTSATNHSLGVVYVDPDLVTGSVLLGNGDGTLQAAPILNPSSESVDNIVAIGSGDVNGDGIADFIAFDYTNQYAANNPNGFPSIITMISDGKGGLKQTVTAIPDTFFIKKNSENFMVESLVADLNGDGKADLLLSLGDDIEIALGNGDGTFQTPRVLNLGSAFGFEQLDCQLGGASAGKGVDGVLEFVVAYGGDDSCSQTGSQPSGVFVFTDGGAKVNFFPLGSSLIDAKLTDLNLDGILDLITTDADATTVTYAVYATQGTGLGNFNVNGTNLLTLDSFVSSVIPGDYNGDGLPDLAITTIGAVDDFSGDILAGTGGVLLLPGHGDGTFGATTEVNGGQYLLGGAWGDFNGDGRLDLAVSELVGSYADGYFAGNVYNFAVMPNAGNGTFALSNAYGVFGIGPVFSGDYNGDGSADAAFPSGRGNSFTLMLNALRKATTTTLTVTPSTAQTGQSVTLLATVSTANGTPTGSVVFMNGSTAIGTGQVTDGSATLSVTSLPAGNDSITAVYGGDAGFAGSTSAAVVVTISQAVASTSTALTASANAPTPGQTVSFTALVSSAGGTPTGTVNFMNGTTLLATETLSAGVATFSTTSLPLGANSVIAIYGGSAQFSTSLSAPVQVTVAAPFQASTTTLAVSAAGATAGQNITLTATVASTSSGTPTGTVTFQNLSAQSGSMTLGTVTLNAQGVATLATTALPPGADTVTATYSGDATFAPSTSPTAQIVEDPAIASVAITANPTSLTIKSGQSGTVSLAVAPVNGFNGAVSISCGQLPAGVTCTFAPSVFNVSGDLPTLGTLTINTNGLAQLHNSLRPDQSPLFAATLFTPGLLGLVLAATGRRSGSKRPRSLQLLVALLLLGGGLGLTACAGPAASQNAPPGSATIAITAKSTTLSSSPSLNLQVTIQ